MLFGRTLNFLGSGPDRNPDLRIFKDRRPDLMLPVQPGFGSSSTDLGLDRRFGLSLHSPCCANRYKE